MLHEPRVVLAARRLDRLQALAAEIQNEGGEALAIPVDLSQPAEIEVMVADWEAAKTRVQRYATDLLPLAHQRVEVTLAGYRGGRGDLSPVLDARKGEIEIRMKHVEAQSEMARGWANLNFLLLDNKEQP